jgi:hypothetical protein
MTFIRFENKLALAISYALALGCAVGVCATCANQQTETDSVPATLETPDASQVWKDAAPLPPWEDVPRYEPTRTATPAFVLRDAG